MLIKTSPKYARMIDGSSDTEHLAALYLSRLDEENSEYRINNVENKSWARSMWNALQRTIRQIEEIQVNRFGEKPDNTLTICTSMCSSSF